VLPACFQFRDSGCEGNSRTRTEIAAFARARQNAVVWQSLGGFVTERFYSGEGNGRVFVRDGLSGGKKTLPEPRSVLSRYGEKGRGGAGSNREGIAMALLADALGNEARALETHEVFSRRVVALFPERWTISRSRVLS
jgi:hypothetical protein